MLYFNFIIYALIFIFLVFIIVTYLQTIRFMKLEEKKYLNLKMLLNKEEKKHQINSEYLLMSDKLNQTIFNDFFKINRDIILLYKHFI
jgi:predicted Holliday junction resolvase-like endonuclease